MAAMIKAHLARDEARIYHETHGDENAPIMLLTHAYGASSAMWHSQIDALAQNWRVIIWDMRGHGLTKTPEEQRAFFAPAHARRYGGAARALSCTNNAVHRRIVARWLSYL